ncbi:MAG: HAD family phosphatase [Paludibacter sp.]|jgi:putative hydrolase of the HAD superfamily|nr:HAD family phosphatase [Paludibacter sp.]
MSVSTLIFDLGGVIINLDLPLCINNLKKLGFTDVERYLSNYGQQDFFLAYELGKIDTDTFLQHIAALNPHKVEIQDIADAWKSFLQDIPQERLSLLWQLRDKYRLLLLSNTNELHFDVCARNEFRKSGHEIEEYFEKCYVSNKMGMAKPNQDVFRYILADAGVKAEECLFLDDGQKNIQTAADMGFQTFLVDGNNHIEFLKNLIKEQRQIN